MNNIESILLIFSSIGHNGPIEDIVLYTDMPLYSISKIKLKEPRRELAHRVCYCFDKHSDRWYKFRTNTLGNTFIYVGMVKKISKTTLLKYQQHYRLSQVELLLHSNQQIRTAATSYLKTLRQ